MTTKQENRARADWQRRCRANDRSQLMSTRYSWEHCPAYSLYKPQPVAAYICRAPLVHGVPRGLYAGHPTARGEVAALSTRVDSFAQWRERFAVLQADDWFIWVEDRRTGLVWSYNTELWEEWLDGPPGDYMGESNPPDGPAVARMIPFAWRYSPDPWRVWSDELDRELDRQETRAEWDARRGAEAERMLEHALARAYADA